MMIMPLLLTNLLLTAANDTVWWNSDSGSVVEHRDRDAASCTLTLDDQHGQIVFVWDRAMPTRVAVTQRAWKNTPGQITNVAVRIGEVWLDHGDGVRNITAMTATSSYMFILNQPVDDLLLAARDIAVRTPDGGFQITLIPRKVQALVTALHKCQAVIARL